MNVKSLHVSFFVCRFERGRRPLRFPPSPSASLTGENRKRPWKKAELSQPLRGDSGPIRDESERKRTSQRQESEKDRKDNEGYKLRRPAQKPSNPLSFPLKNCPRMPEKGPERPGKRLHCPSHFFGFPPHIPSLLFRPHIPPLYSPFLSGYEAKSESYEGEEHIV